MKIVIYSKNNCQFCTKAKHLVKTLGLEYEEKSLEKDFGSDPVMSLARRRRRTDCCAQSSVSFEIASAP